MILPALTEANSPFWRPIKYSLFPPLGLATLAACLDAEVDVEIRDEHVETLDLEDALHGLARAQVPIESYFCGLGGADVSAASWSHMARLTAEAGARGCAGRRWRLVHDGVEVGGEESP